MLESAKAWGVRECIWRVQQKLIGRGCDRPMENCLVFAPVEGVFDHSEGEGMPLLRIMSVLWALRNPASQPTYSLSVWGV
jgi:hypothetical protein